MDSRLDRFLDQQDQDYATYRESDNGTQITPQDQRAYLRQEIDGIERIMAIDDKHSLVTPAEWNDRLVECRARLRRLLEQERATLKSTSELHCQGLIKVHLRQLEIESDLRNLEVSHVA